MTDKLTTYTLGDSAVTAELGSGISEQLNEKVIAMQQWLAAHPFDGMKELVLAYSSLTVYYDLFMIKKKYDPPVIHEWVEEKLRESFEKSSESTGKHGELHHIPVCYEGEYANDLESMANLKQVTREKIIDLHTSKQYRVYMIGFLPGFPYMGEVDPQLIQARKLKPSLVKAGSVGIAGAQTGIYPFNSPGGWNIIGRTPINLFNAEMAQPVWLKPGDQVKFYAIGKEEFEAIKSKI